MLALGLSGETSEVSNAAGRGRLILGVRKKSIEWLIMFRHPKYVH